MACLDPFFRSLYRWLCHLTGISRTIRLPASPTGLAASLRTFKAPRLPSHSLTSNSPSQIAPFTSSSPLQAALIPRNHFTPNRHTPHSYLPKLRSPPLHSARPQTYNMRIILLLAAAVLAAAVPTPAGPDAVSEIAEGVAPRAACLAKGRRESKTLAFLMCPLAEACLQSPLRIFSAPVSISLSVRNAGADSGLLACNSNRSCCSGVCLTGGASFGKCK